MIFWGKLGILLDGGGLGGAQQPGPAKAVWDYAARYAIDLLTGDNRLVYIQGVSVGALNGSSIAQYGNPRVLLATWLNFIEKQGPEFIFDRGLWHVLTTDHSRFSRILRWLVDHIGLWGILQYFHAIMGHEHLYDSQGIEFLINQMDYATIVLSGLYRFDVVTMNQTTERREIFSTFDADVRNNPALLKQAVRASVALPGVFSSVDITRLINGKEITATYSDGYVFNIQAALDAGCDTVFIFSNDPINHTHRPLRAWYDKFDYTRHLLTRSFIQDELDRYAHDPRVVVFRLVDEGVRTLHNDHFFPGDVRRTVDVTYANALTILERLYG